MPKQQLTLRRRAGFVLSSGLMMLAGAVLHAACEKEPGARAAPSSDKGEVLAKVDDVTISVAEFQERINQQSPYVRARYTSLERKKEFLDNLVRFEVLAKEAQRRGLERDPEVVRTMKQVMIQKLLKQQLDQQHMADITDAECKAYYDQHRDEFNQPDEVRVSAILVKDARTAKRVLADARLTKGDNEGFRKLVTEYSQDLATKDRGGDLRYFDAKSKDVPPPLVEAAFKLQNIGDVSPAVKTDQGIAILKLTGRRKALSRSFDEVKQQIRNRLYREKRQQEMERFIKSLRDKATIRIDQAKLAKVRVEGVGPGQFPGPGLPPPGPGMFHPGAPGAPHATPMQPGGAAQNLTPPN